MGIRINCSPDLSDLKQLLDLMFTLLRHLVSWAQMELKTASTPVLVSLLQRVVTDLILQNSPEYPVKHYSAFQGDSGDVCGSVLRHFLGTDGEILFPGWSLDLSVKLTLDTFVFHILVAKSWRCRLQASRSAVTIYKATLCSAWGSWPNLTASRRNLLLPPRKTDHALRCYQCLNLEACQSGGASFV